MTRRAFWRRALAMGSLAAILLGSLICLRAFAQGGKPSAAPAAAATADPGGTTTGSIKDVTAKEPGAPTMVELGDQVGKNKIAINFVWVLLAGFLVFFMQAGFALIETGFTRAKNAAETMAMNMVIYGLGVAGFFIGGFAIMFGGVGAVANLGGTPGLVDHEFALRIGEKTLGLFGTHGFFLTGDVYDVGVLALFLFQVVFMDAAATIPTGAMAERWRFKSFCVWGLFCSILLYPLYGNWVWGGGWLSQLGANFGLGHGFVDFAGSSVVHAVGGIASLAGITVLGARIGKFRKDGTPVAIPGHNIPLAVTGMYILAFGWFGFNSGSTLAGTDLRIAVVAVNTMLASVAGMLTSMLYMWKRVGKPDPAMTANGTLAGLVAITAPCAFVSPWAAFTIGGIAGILVVLAAFFIERKLKLDDPVGAVAVHGVNGLWGVISLGLFADGTYGAGLNSVGADNYLGAAGKGVTGLFYGDSSQFVAQLIGALTCALFVFGSSYAFFKISNRFVPMRTPANTEIVGLDLPEVGILAYPRDVM